MDRPSKPDLEKIWIFNEALKELSDIITIGENKYGALTWKEFFRKDPDKCMGSILRHLCKISEGESVDLEDQFLHWGAVAFRSLAMCQILIEDKMEDIQWKN